MKISESERKILVQAFRDSLNTNLMLAKKEVWYISDSLPACELSMPCVVRYLVTAHNTEEQGENHHRKSRIAIQLAKRGVQTIILCPQLLIRPQTLLRFLTRIVRSSLI